MGTETKETIEILSDLIQIHKDRIRSYERYSKFIQDKNTKLEELITQLIGESYKSKLDLTCQVQLTEAIDPGNIYRGKIYRDWLDQRQVIDSENHRSITEAFNVLENALKDAYRVALKEKLLPHARRLIEFQQKVIENTHNKIRAVATQIRV